MDFKKNKNKISVLKWARLLGHAVLGLLQQLWVPERGPVLESADGGRHRLRDTVAGPQGLPHRPRRPEDAGQDQGAMLVGCSLNGLI